MKTKIVAQINVNIDHRFKLTRKQSLAMYRLGGAFKDIAQSFMESPKQKKSKKKGKKK